jgi:hypothetical protein
MEVDRVFRGVVCIRAVGGVVRTGAGSRGTTAAVLGVGASKWTHANRAVWATRREEGNRRRLPIGPELVGDWCPSTFLHPCLGPLIVTGLPPGALGVALLPGSETVEVVSGSDSPAAKDAVAAPPPYASAAPRSLVTCTPSLCPDADAMNTTSLLAAAAALAHSLQRGSSSTSSSAATATSSNTSTTGAPAGGDGDSTAGSSPAPPPVGVAVEVDALSYTRELQRLPYGLLVNRAPLLGSLDDTWLVMPPATAVVQQQQASAATQAVPTVMQLPQMARAEEFARWGFSIRQVGSRTPCVGWHEIIMRQRVLVLARGGAALQAVGDVATPFRSAPHGVSLSPAVPTTCRGN